MPPPPAMTSRKPVPVIALLPLLPVIAMPRPELAFAWLASTPSALVPVVTPAIVPMTRASTSTWSESVRSSVPVVAVEV